MPHTVSCVKLGREAEGLAAPPYPGESGKRIYENVSKEAWQQWLAHQTMLINEYRLTPFEPKARQFLEQEMEKYFFGAGSETPKDYVPPAADAPLPDSPALAHLFAGVVALADQVGSNQEFFEFEPATDPNYVHRARKQAEKALRRTGFRRADRPGRAKPSDFRSLFEHEEPRPLQKAVEEAPLDRPLLILESETGSGKTEAAIIRFAALWRAGLVDGLYFALPTRSAAKQIHARVHAALTMPMVSPASMAW